MLNEEINCILVEPSVILKSSISGDTTRHSILTTEIDNVIQTPFNINNNNNNNNDETGNLIELDNYANTQNINCSNNSLNSENLSSPMQTSTDIFIDSELLSTDLTSNDSQSPKNIVQNPNEETRNFDFDCNKIVDIYASTETFSHTKSDQSLLNSEESSEEDSHSPIRKLNRDYKKVNSKKHKTKKYFGVKTLQSIFSKYDGYSDISSTASGDFCDDLSHNNTNKADVEENDNRQEMINVEDENENKCDGARFETTEQFEENIHNILSEMFTKNFSNLDYHHHNNQQSAQSSITVNKTIGNKKHFKMYGQQLRVGKALRLCPNDELGKRNNLTENERKEKLLARYVYNANSIGADGVGDPDFGTPV